MPTHGAFKEYFVALIGIFGVVIGIGVTHYLDGMQEKSKTRFEFEKYIFDKRIELLEKASHILGQKPTVEDTWNKYISSVSFNKKGIKYNNSAIELSEKLAKYKSDYQTTLGLVGSFYGPKTNKILLQFNTPTDWRTVNEPYLDSLFKSMTNEMYYNLSEFKSTLAEKKQ